MKRSWCAFVAALAGAVAVAARGGDGRSDGVKVFNDSHHTTQNRRPDRLAGRASLISGAQTPVSMMEGLGMRTFVTLIALTRSIVEPR